MAEISLPDNDYFLSEYAAWFTFGNLSIRIRPAASLEGIIRATDHPYSKVPPDLTIDVYTCGREIEDELASVTVPQPPSDCS